MYDFFETVLNMSITAGILALAVIVLRFFMKRVPKKFVCILWALVALRLVCPISISSPLSAYNLVQSGNETVGRIEYSIPQTVTGASVPVTANYELSSSNTKVSPIAYVWLTGSVLMLSYALFSYALLKRKVCVSKKYEKNIFISRTDPAPLAVLIFINPAFTNINLFP